MTFANFCHACYSWAVHARRIPVIVIILNTSIGTVFWDLDCARSRLWKGCQLTPSRLLHRAVAATSSLWIMLTGTQTLSNSIESTPKSTANGRSRDVQFQYYLVLAVKPSTVLRVSNTSESFRGTRPAISILSGSIMAQYPLLPLRNKPRFLLEEYSLRLLQALFITHLQTWLLFQTERVLLMPMSAKLSLKSN